MNKRFDELTVLENSIVPIYEKNCIDGSNLHEQVVNARELWQMLESKQEFSNWVKKRIIDVDAIENIDYYTIDKKINRQILKEYIVTIDIAKEMSMLERNEKGKMIRRYFIEAEKRYRDIKITRARSKAERRLFTDVLRELLPESPHQNMQYKNYTDLVYKVVTGYNAKQLRVLYDKPKDYNVRELLTPQQIKEVMRYECIIQGLMNLGQDYQGVKAILENPAAYLPSNVQ